jgi:hypothetical protein
MIWPVEVLVCGHLLVNFSQPFHAADSAHGIEEVRY